jgi:hypothetical protein
MFDLKTHAHRELLIAGYSEEAIKILTDSGDSLVDFGKLAQAPEGRDMAADVQKILNWEPLTPLTNDPAEWEEVDAGDATADHMRPGVEFGMPDDALLRNRRDRTAFSYDGGLTYGHALRGALTHSEAAGYWIDDHDERHISQQRVPEGRESEWVASLASKVNRAFLDAEAEGAS